MLELERILRLAKKKETIKMEEMLHFKKGATQLVEDAKTNNKKLIKIVMNKNKEIFELKNKLKILENDNSVCRERLLSIMVYKMHIQ